MHTVLLPFFCSQEEGGNVLQSPCNQHLATLAHSEALRAFMCVCAGMLGKQAKMKDCVFGFAYN